MGWDPSVMRKFAATSHQRLVHQLRSELRNDSLPRPLPKGVSGPDSNGTAVPQVNASSSSNQGQRQDKRPRRSKPFRERLNAIDMR